MAVPTALGEADQPQSSPQVDLHQLLDEATGQDRDSPLTLRG
jgi:hypothetical protein